MTTTKPDTEQTAVWNGSAGCAWVDAEPVLNAMFKPLEELLVEKAAARSARSVLDVGCGTGATTRSLARALRASERCVGIDISAPMIEAASAHARAERSAATFIQADAEHHRFDPASFDLIVSRFGVMFFEDAVRAFSNLRAATRVGGELLFVTWRDAAENPFMTTAERVAAPILANAGVALAPRVPGAPGQFGLADPERAIAYLAQSQWTDIELRPIDVTCAFPVRALELYVTRMGPLGRVFGQLDDALRTHVRDAVTAAFQRYVDGDEVRFVAACWSITARRR